MKVIIAGGTGMVGALLVKICLASEKISEVRSLVRKPTGLKHTKLTEFVIQDFEDYSIHQQIFENIAVAFFCIGAYTGAVPDVEFKKITVNYAVAFATALKQQSPEATICLLSGAGADSTEKSKTPFARYKGMAENKISSLNTKSYSFRPGYIYPVEPRKEPNIGYKILRLAYPVLKLFGKNISIRSDELARAMFNVGMNGADKKILENRDILGCID
jgi:uncharacterized protein YbjT (DUF2867 family)